MQDFKLYSKLPKGDRMAEIFNFTCLSYPGQTS